jgi:hypothetical protein
LFKVTEISCEFAYARLEFRNHVEEAIGKRRKLIEKMNLLLRRFDEDEKLKIELKRIIGSYEGEMENLQYLRTKIDELYNKVINKGDRITLDDFSNFEVWLTDGRRRLGEFEAGTVMGRKILEKLYPESEYRIRWNDEGDG